MRGRKTELQAIEGGLARIPVAPSWLPSDAKAEWRRIIGDLCDRRVLTRADLGVVESYCLSAGLVRSSQRLIGAEGEMVTTSRGDQRRHPAHQTLFQALTEARRLAAELGLSPASRSKAAMLADGQNDDLADLDL